MIYPFSFFYGASTGAIFAKREGTGGLSRKGIGPRRLYFMQYMTSNELRERFLQFFQARQHKRLPSASLVPQGDPTLLLTGAGMVPFKPYFLGKEVPEYRRVTTCQRCLRTQDIDNVGKTDRHGTFFEMLGNFSFGDYFKREAIRWAWEFVTQELRFPADKLWVTVYQDDDEAATIWQEEAGIPVDRIVRLGREDNFWEIGVGPCGPCSELHFDRGPEYGCGREDCKPGCDCDRYLEFWNLVFVQYHQDEEGNLHPLQQTGIDTGLGLDRTAALLQGVAGIFDTDLVKPIREKVADLAGVNYGSDPDKDVALRVITDHARSMTFMALDGILPSNEGRGYVLRRLLRRAARYGRLLGLEEPFLREIASQVIELMKPGYPELEERRDYILQVIGIEEERFQETLGQGLHILQEMMAGLRQKGIKELPGDDAFRLYDTFGFPLELTCEILTEQNMTVDEEGFAQRMEEQRQRARAAREETGYLGKEDASLYTKLRRENTVEFIGYDRLETEARIQALIVDGKEVEKVTQGQEVEVVITPTPFYAESGGQIADTGTITAVTGAITVTDVVAPVRGLVVQRGTVASGYITRGDVVMATVDGQERQATARNHTATHLLHRALKDVLGEHVNQAGSLVAPDRLRFDFTHFAAVTSDQLEKVEKLVNDIILQNLPVQVEEMSFAEARKQGAVALFGEKYGDWVRVISVGDYSKELCGGTHVRSTGELGIFKLVTETAVGAGVRRIEAVTGRSALERIAAEETVLQSLSTRLQTKVEELPQRVDRLLQELKEVQKKLEVAKAKVAASQRDRLLQQARDIGGVTVLAAKVEDMDASDLRSLGDQLREKLGSGMIILGSATAGKALFVAMATPDVVKKGIRAGDVIKVAARAAGGGGGGRPDMAQAGGRQPEKIEEALQLATQSIKEQLAVV